LNFWRAVVDTIAHYVTSEVKSMLRVWLGLHFFELLVEPFSWVVEINVAVDIECRAIETSRDPPSIFIPLPKIELNGCARSDLPIRSLIF
jgi:hypothetical protein